MGELLMATVDPRQPDDRLLLENIAQGFEELSRLVDLAFVNTSRCKWLLGNRLSKASNRP